MVDWINLEGHVLFRVHRVGLRTSFITRSIFSVVKFHLEAAILVIFAMSNGCDAVKKFLAINKILETGSTHQAGDIFT